jgi:magnesium and cobalt transporter
MSTQGNMTEASSEPAPLLPRIKSWLRAMLRDQTHDVKEALEEVLDEHTEGGTPLPPEEQNMLKNVLSFGELEVKDIMTPRSEIKAVEYNVSLDELKAHIAQHRHTRVPVYNDTLDNIKGFVHTKDLVPLLSGDEPFNMALVLRDVLFVPPSMKLIALLFKMRMAGVHMAMVIDEYGGTDGLVTLEDLFEEIVGDIHDEHDEEEQEAPLSWGANHSCDVDARVTVDKLEKELGLELRPATGEKDYDTLGGLIFHQLGRVPVRNEIIEHGSGTRFEILAADPRRIQTVRIYASLVAQAKTDKNILAKASSIA